MRMRGRCSRSCVAAGARTTTSRPSSVVALWGVIANDATAAHVTASPAEATGTTTASSRGAGRARCLTAPLPVQVQESEIVVRTCERKQEQDEDHGERNEAWTPLQHRQPPQKTKHDVVDSGFPGNEPHPPKGGLWKRRTCLGRSRRRRPGPPRRAAAAPTRTSGGTSP